MYNKRKYVAPVVFCTEPCSGKAPMQTLSASGLWNNSRRNRIRCSLYSFIEYSLIFLSVYRENTLGFRKILCIKKPVSQEWKTGTNFYKPEGTKKRVRLRQHGHCIGRKDEGLTAQFKGSRSERTFHRNWNAYFSEASVCGIYSAYRIVDHWRVKKLIDNWILPGFHRILKIILDGSRTLDGLRS